MKALKFANLLVLILAVTVTAIGCKKKPTGVTPLPPGSTGSSIGDSGLADLETGGSLGDSEPMPTDMTRLDNMNADAQALAPYTVYFGFDSSVVAGSELGKVDSVAGALIENPQNAVRIEGHCDERGTEGYNLALGERRALALRDALIAVGVDPNNIVTLSYGEEMPANPGHDEIAWSENRRGEFILLLP
jgi:peptidoglycan-associated lipoprotein